MPFSQAFSPPKFELRAWVGQLIMEFVASMIFKDLLNISEAINTGNSMRLIDEYALDVDEVVNIRG